MILRMDAAAPSHRHMLQLQYVQRREDNDDTSFRKVRWAANIIKLWWKKTSYFGGRNDKCFSYAYTDLKDRDVAA